MKVCPNIYKPVCATNGETFSNLCSLEIADCKSNGAIAFGYDGECGRTFYLFSFIYAMSVFFTNDDFEVPDFEGYNKTN